MAKKIYKKKMKKGKPSTRKIWQKWPKTKRRAKNRRPKNRIANFCACVAACVGSEAGSDASASADGDAAVKPLSGDLDVTYKLNALAQG